MVAFKTTRILDIQQHKIHDSKKRGSADFGSFLKIKKKKKLLKELNIYR
jgi:hypothetical protein